MASIACSSGGSSRTSRKSRKSGGRTLSQPSSQRTDNGRWMFSRLLKCEARPAAAGRLGVRIIDAERGADQVVYEIDFGAPRARAIFIRPREEPRPAWAGS